MASYVRNQFLTISFSEKLRIHEFKIQNNEGRNIYRMILWELLHSLKLVKGNGLKPIRKLIASIIISQTKYYTKRY
jgi:hypothetical protein